MEETDHASGNSSGGDGVSGKAKASSSYFSSLAQSARMATTELARGHVRMGWARHEASLDALVGFLTPAATACATCAVRTCRSQRISSS